MGEISDTEYEAYGIEDVGLSRAIETSNGIEVRIKIRNHSSRRVGLESLQADLLDVHFGGEKTLEIQLELERVGVTLNMVGI